MALLEINRDPTPRQVWQFGLLWLPAFCLLLGGMAIYRFASWPAAVFLALCAALSILVGALRPPWIRALFIGWMWAAFPIGWVVSHVLIAVIYFLVICPIGLAMRAAGHDPLARKFDPLRETYWTERSPKPDPSNYFRQF